VLVLLADESQEAVEAIVDGKFMPTLHHFDLQTNDFFSQKR